MKDDVRNLIYGVIGLFVVVLILWIGYVFIAGCGFSLDCEKAANIPERTPIPTLIPAGLPAPDTAQGEVKVACQVTAVGLIGAWVDAGYPESESFTFTDQNGAPCTGVFPADVQPLFLEGNLWYTGAPACTTCHNSNLNAETAGMDLSTFAGILQGSRRTSPDQAGNDILGGGEWTASLLYTQLFVTRQMPQGRPPDVPAEGPVIFAGSAAQD